MGREVQLGGPLGGPLGGALGLRPSSGGVGSAVPLIQLLLVGGGGAGDVGNVGAVTSGLCPAGGAGGQVLEIEIPSPAPGSYPVTIGLGSQGYFPGLATETRFGTLLIAIGGGTGGLAANQNYGEFGFISGFNSAGLHRFGAFYVGRPLGGFPGGNFWANYSSIRSGGGGGGAGGAGGDATSAAPGLGGPGRVSSLSGAPVEYGRGGTGGHETIGRGAPAFGPGGGGGGSKPGVAGNGEPGNPGILILRYLTRTQAWTGGDISQVGPWTIHTCTADTTLTRTA